MHDDRIQALMRLLTSEGHISPIGALQVIQVVAAHDAEVARAAKAEALREAAEDVEQIDGRRDDAAATWLRARADQIESGSESVTHVGPEEYVVPSGALRALAAEHGITPP